MNTQKSQLESIAQSLCQPELRHRLQRDGYLYQENVVPWEWCDAMLNDFNEANYFQVDRKFDWLTVKFATLNGQDLSQSVRFTTEIYEKIESVVSYLSQRPYRRLNNTKIGLSMNLMSPGDVFSRHFDRHRVSFLVYLNQVEGGDLLLWPFVGMGLQNQSWRRFCNNFSYRLADWFKPVRIGPKQGAVLMFTNRCLHGVDKIAGNQPRCSLVLGYDRPESIGKFDQDTDYYGYSESHTSEEQKYGTVVDTRASSFFGLVGIMLV